MIPAFIILLAALGAAFVFKGRERRGLLVLLVAHATGALVTAAYGRWGWMAFFLGCVALCLVGAVLAKRPA